MLQDASIFYVMNENIKYASFDSPDGKVKMSKKTLARWLCLAEAFYIIEKKSTDLGISLDKKDWVKPLAFEKYIQQRFESMVLDMEIDAKEGVFDDIKIMETEKTLQEA